MSDYRVSDTSLTSVANAIRTKGGTNGSLIFPEGFVTAIGNIQTASTPNLQAKTGITPLEISQTITADQGYDGLSSVQIDAIPSVPKMTLIATREQQINSSSTSEIIAFSLTGLTGVSSSDNIVYVRIRDKAGERAGYFYGSDTFYVKVGDSGFLRATYRCTGAGVSAATYGTTGYGVFPSAIGGRDNSVQVSYKYNSTNSLTINGTFVTDVYLLDWDY